MLNFFRAIPEELEEAAFMDGANHWNILARIYIPLSQGSIATICLFALVYHWNSWFDGIILMNKPTQYPLQSYLQTIIIQGGHLCKQYHRLADHGTGFRQNGEVRADFPVHPAYCGCLSFFTEVFCKGMVMGSVKG